MKIFLFFLALFLNANDCLISWKIPFPEKEYNNKVFNNVSSKDIDNWVYSKEKKNLGYQTYAKPEGLGEYYLIYAWCSNLNQFVLVAYYNDVDHYYRYNPIFLNLSNKPPNK